MEAYLERIRTCISVWQAVKLSAKSKAARKRAVDVWDTLLEEENRVYCVIHLGFKDAHSAGNWDLREVRRASKVS